MTAAHTAPGGRPVRAGRIPAEEIRPEGLYSWNDFADRIPYSRETWRKRVLDGTAPTPALRTGSRTAWRGRDLLEWLDDPEGYVASPARRTR